MNAQVWSWVLTAVGLTGFYLSGNKVWWAWYVNLANQLIWIPYSIITHQWGFLVGALFYTAFFTRNSIKWTKEHRAKKLKPYEELREYAIKDIDLTNDLYEFKGPKEAFKPGVILKLDTSDFSKSILASKEQIAKSQSLLEKYPYIVKADGLYFTDPKTGEEIKIESRVESTPLYDEPCTGHYVFGKHVVLCRLARHDMDGEHEGQHFDVSGREVTTIRWSHNMMYIVDRRRQEKE